MTDGLIRTDIKWKFWIRLKQRARHTPNMEIMLMLLGQYAYHRMLEMTPFDFTLEDTYLLVCKNVNTQFFDYISMLLKNQDLENVDL